MRTDLLRFNRAVERDPTIDEWMKEHAGELGAIAHHWFEVMRKCGDEVRELIHDGCPVACLGDAPFGYVNVFTSHVNVGFFHGATLPDPARLLQGNGNEQPGQGSWQFGREALACLPSLPEIGNPGSAG